MHDEPLEQDSRNLLLNHLRLGLREEIKQHAAEVVRVLVGVAELVGHRVEEEVPPLGVQFVRELRTKKKKEASNRKEGEQKQDKKKPQLIRDTSYIQRGYNDSKHQHNVSQLRTGAWMNHTRERFGWAWKWK